MDKNQGGFISKILLVIAILVAVGAMIYFFSQSKQTNTPTQSSVTTPSPSPSISPETSLLVDAAIWYPSAPWSQPSSSSQQTVYGDLSGESIQATISSPSASISHFEMTDQLNSDGFTLDNNLAADGPGSSVWGYKKDSNGQSQVMIFSYNTQPTSSSPNEPLQFNCPCKMTINVFVSNPFTPKQ